MKNGDENIPDFQMYKRRAQYRLKGTKRPIIKTTKTPVSVIKAVGGNKNGKERVVFTSKPKANFPTKTFVKKRAAKGTFSAHKRYTRRNMKPGRVLILLAGRHQGKRVILLKVLPSGLLLVTGPFGLNSCPLRRVSQRYVIGCSTRLDLATVKVPEHINDEYFRRIKSSKGKKQGEGDIFAAKKEKFVPTEQRKADQKTVDEQVLKVIKANPDGKYVRKYLQSMFSLTSSQYPHRMKF